MSAHGRASHPCPNCGKFVEFDYDNLTAKINEAYDLVLKQKSQDMLEHRLTLCSNIPWLSGDLLRTPIGSVI